MATIQVREIPEDAYEVLRRRARAAGQSIQAYMRERVTEMAQTPTKGEVRDIIEAVLRDRGSAGTSPEDIVADVTAERP